MFTFVFTNFCFWMDLSFTIMRDSIIVPELRCSGAVLVER